jgi:hypothetical protein
VLLDIRPKSKELSGKKEIRIPYTVKNLWTAPEQSLSVHLAIRADFAPPDKIVKSPPTLPAIPPLLRTPIVLDTF